MRLTKLRTVNFKHLGGSSGEFALDFSDGVIGIRGPNESGKSSIMQAVFFALTGQPLEGGREIGHYVRYGASRAKVELGFEVDGRKYLVERLIRRKEGELDKGTSQAYLYELREGRRLRISSGVREVSERIHRFLGGLGAEELRSTIFIIQKDLERLKEKRTQERKELIDSLIGRESFDKAKGVLNDRRKELEGTPWQKGEIEKAKEHMERLRKDLEEYREKRRELEGAEERIAVLEGPEDLEGSIKEQEAILKEVEGKLEVLERYKGRRDELDAKLRDLRGRENRLRVEVENLEEKKRELIRALDELERVQREIEGLESPESEGSIGRLEREKEEELGLLMGLKELKGLKDRLERLNYELKRALSEVEKRNERIEEKEELVRKTESRIRELAKERKRLKAELKVARRKEADVKLVAGGLTLLGALAVGISLAMPQIFTLSLLTLLLGLGTYFVWGVRYSGLARDLEGDIKRVAREMEDKRENLDGYKKELEFLKKERKRHQRESEELSKKVKELRKEIDERLRELERRSKGGLKLSLDELDSLLDEKNKEIMELSNRISKAKERLNNLKRRMEELEERIKGFSQVPKMLEDKSRELEEVRKGINAIQREIEGLEEELPEELRPFSPELLESYRERRKEAYGELERRKEELKNLRKTREKLFKRLKELEGIEEKVKEAENRLRELERSSRVVKKALDLLDMAAKATREAVRPAIEYGMSTILPVMTEGRYGSVRIDEESFDVEVYDSEAGSYVRLDRFSGGTVDQVLLAMRLAFTLSVIPKMRGSHPEFLFMDEVLASSDSQRRKGIMELVTKNLRDQFAQIIAISHQEDVLRYADRRVVMRDGELSSQDSSVSSDQGSLMGIEEG